MYAVSRSDIMPCFTYTVHNIHHPARLTLLPSFLSPLPPFRNHNMDFLKNYFAWPEVELKFCPLLLLLKYWTDRSDLKAGILDE